MKRGDIGTWQRKKKSWGNIRDWRGNGIIREKRDGEKKRKRRMEGERRITR